MNLEEMIKNLFAGQHQEVNALLRKYEINQTIENVIDILNQDNAHPSHQTNFGSLVSAYLTNINTKLRSMESLEDKQQLEQIVSAISRKLIFTTLKKSSLDLKTATTELVSSLSTACAINDYDFDELNRFLHLDTIKELAEVANEKMLDTQGEEKIAFYDWLGEPYELDELARNLKSNKAIQSIKAFKKLFEPHDGKVTVQADPNHLDFIVILFDNLKHQKLIKARGQKGHFTPLTKYLVDLENENLIKKPPKHIKYTINKNPAKSQVLHDKAQKWIQSMTILK